MFVHRRDLGGAPSRTPVGDPAAAAPWCGRAGRLALAAALMAAAAGCTSSPEYPIRAGERAGDGSIMADQPRYPISAQDAAQNAQDRAAQQGYPAYGAPPVAPPASGPYGPPPAAAPPASDDAADEAPRPLPNRSVESSDLPPPPAAPPAGDAPPPPPPEDAPQPHALSWGGGQIVFGTDGAEPPTLELAVYRHRRRKAAETAAAADDSATAKAPARHGRRRHAADRTDDAAAPASASADTPYQTVVRPGEKLADVAERTHSSREALTQLNDLKHPRRVKAGTVLKIPYRYSYQVQKGDTLYTISHRFSQDPDAMAKLNGLKHAAELQPGQTLTLPTDVSDAGKRDHAAASPIPVAAPDKLADSASKPIGRHDRRHRKAAEVASAETAAPAPDTAAAVQSPPAHETRRERRRREREEAANARLASAHPGGRPSSPGAAAHASDGRASPAAEVAADARPLRPSPEPLRPSPQPLRTSPEPVPTASAAPLRPSPEPVRPAPSAATVATAATPRTPSFVPPSVTPGPIPRATASAAVGAPTTPQPYYAGVRSSSTATVSTYAGGARVASLTPPRYTPGLPAGAYEPSLGRARPLAPSTPAGPVSSSEVAVAGRGRFIWPLRGQIVSAFGIKGEGQHNDGLDIAVAPGTGVRAAAAGEVVYAGSSIPGFGNLVLVKHAGGWVTAYAHLDRIEVRMRDTVAQGEEIGQSGQTGAVDRPLLHFEVRYAADPTEKARPVDPALVLPTG